MFGVGALEMLVLLAIFLALVGLVAWLLTRGQRH